MANLNQVFLMGRLTRDPELRYTPSGVAVADLGLAINRTYTTKDGERREEVLFIDVTVWNRQAENCCQYLKKGRQVHVEGHLKMESWDDKTTGEKRTKIKVEADRVQFLASRRDDAAGGGGSGGDDLAPPRESRRPSSNGSARPAPTSQGAPPRRPVASAEPEGDDDIPF